MSAPATLSEALPWLRVGLPPDAGFRVHYEHKVGIFLDSHCWPSRAEAPLPTEEIAWAYARAFANRHTVGRFVNIYVIDNNSVPVQGYRQKMIENRLAPVIVESVWA